MDVSLQMIRSELITMCFALALLSGRQQTTDHTVRCRAAILRNLELSLLHAQHNGVMVLLAIESIRKALMFLFLYALGWCVLQHILRDLSALHKS